MEFFNLTMHQIKEKLGKKDVKATEILDDVLKRIDDVEDKIGAHITLTEDMAYKKAEEIDKKIENNQSIGILGGIPMSIKDNICTEGILTTCASKMLQDFVPPYSAAVYEKLLTEDAVMLGKSNMDEFGMGSSTETSFYKKTKNPWNMSKVPGGSSGGSAAAVSAGECFFALGSDTGGSVRQPSAFCGVVGLKPTYGLVSRYGLIAVANSLDQIGPITKDVKDCALVLNIIAGHDPKDATSDKRKRIDYLQGLDDGIDGLKIGIAEQYFDEELSEPVENALLEAIGVFKDLGATCKMVSLPHTKYAMAVYYIISQSEISTNLSRFDGVKYGHRTSDYKNIDELISNTRGEGFGDEVKRRIIMGTYWLNGDNYKKYYEKANEIRKFIKQDFNNIFSECDVLLAPVTATTAFDLGLGCNIPSEKYKVDRYTVPANLAGIPAISIPCGFHDGLPIGMQLMGRKFDEGTLLKTAKAFEGSTDFNSRPKL
ncbi:MAG: Asp-tRNA(Asn)/Glu-tRNA(Gln) amidotransferase subunit GatA [Natronincolaceae bacterium]|nr:Asp-tRNA(Asn)/Glu-tRNA(Gln) amidotransferase subunit GatA [Bacillota bacterium]NLK90920.1 Asp-tRNA(Asn)/Glu-tRNA(Gln) amidotransferase subunit GatA [Clostridiales bacterium]